MTKTYTKSRLFKELAYKVGVKKVLSQKIFDALVEIIYREAANGGFVLPGVCKFDVVERKARRIRNPRTGEVLVLPAHKTLRATLSSIAKRKVAPRPQTLTLEEYERTQKSAEDVAAAVVAAAAPTEAAAPEASVESKPSSAPVAEEAAPVAAESVPAEKPAVSAAGAVSFRCPGCGQEIEAPSEAIGMEAECPMCGRIVVVPKTSDPGTMYGPAAGDGTKSSSEVVTAEEAEEMEPEALKNRTIRIDTTLFGFDDEGGGASGGASAAPVADEKMISFFCKKCHQEIEATADMSGSQGECPNCGTSFVVPYFSDPGSIHDDSAAKLREQQRIQAQKHSTMRINLDEF